MFFRRKKPGSAPTDDRGVLRAIALARLAQLAADDAARAARDRDGAPGAGEIDAEVDAAFTRLRADTASPDAP